MRETRPHLLAVVVKLGDRSNTRVRYFKPMRGVQGKVPRIIARLERHVRCIANNAAPRGINSESNKTSAVTRETEFGEITSHPQHNEQHTENAECHAPGDLHTTDEVGAVHAGRLYHGASASRGRISGGTGGGARLSGQISWPPMPPAPVSKLDGSRLVCRLDRTTLLVGIRSKGVLFRQRFVAVLDSHMNTLYA